jgi:PAS domain S-box-containing protein
MDLVGLRQLTEELIAKDQELKNSNEVLSAFFDMSLDLLCIARNGYFKRLNPAWAKVLGYSEEELLSVPFMDFIHPDDVEKTRAMLSDLHEGQPATYFRNRYRKKDGTYVTLCWTSAPALEDGTLCAIARNYTEMSKKHARNK